MLDRRSPLIPILLLHTLLAVALWTTGSFHGTWTFECGVGTAAWDLVHGRNPAFTWSDYYDSWTSGYLLWALIEAPLTLLPWDPIYALKTVSLLTTAAAATLGWLFLKEVTTERAATLGASLLVLGPPTLWYFAVSAGNYHYTELVPCLALFWRLAVWTKRDDWGPRGALELGVLAGLALATSLGSILPVFLAVVAFVRLHPARMKLPVTWLALPAILLGALPLVFKALQDPFGVPPAEQEFEVPYFSGGIRPPFFGKLLTLPLALSHHVGFGDLNDALWPVDVLFAAIITAIALAALVAGVRSLRDPDRVLPALPGLYVAGLLVIYLLLPIGMQPRSLTTDFRDVRWLPPLFAAAGLALPVLLERSPKLRVELALIPLALGLMGAVLMVPWTDVQPRIPYAATCPIAQGMYAGKVLPPVRDGEPLRPELCAGFGDQAGQCEIGRAASIAVYAQARGRGDRKAQSEGAAVVEELCSALDGAPERACFRQLGWAMINAHLFRPPQDLWGQQKRVCSTLKTSQRQVWCREGLGYWFADHLGGWPDRLSTFLEDAPPQVVEVTLKGVGARLGWAYRDDVDLVRACGRYASLDADACLEGARSVR